MTAPLVVAVDPGPTYTGVVGRSRDTLRAWTVVTRSRFEPLEDYADRVLTNTRTVSDLAIQALHAAEYDVDPLLFAVEAYNTPTPQAGKVDPRQIAETAWLTGWLYAALREESFDGPHDPHRAVLVPPNQHGRSVLAAYPDELVAATERRGIWRTRPAGRTNPVSHARSAWDIAGAAPAQLRTRHAAEGV